MFVISMCVIIELDSQSFVRFEKVLYYSDYSCLSYILSYPKFMFLYLWLIISDNIIRQFTRLLFFSIQYLLLIKQNPWNPLNWWSYQQLSYVQGNRNALSSSSIILIFQIFLIRLTLSLLQREKINKNNKFWITLIRNLYLT